VKVNERERSLLFLFFPLLFFIPQFEKPSSFLVSVSEKEHDERREREWKAREIVEPTHLADLCLKRVRSKGEMEKDLTGEELEEKDGGRVAQRGSVVQGHRIFGGTDRL
jgi:hypothetical protein